MAIPELSCGAIQVSEKAACDCQSSKLVFKQNLSKDETTVESVAENESRVQLELCVNTGHIDFCLLASGIGFVGGRRKDWC